MEERSNFLPNLTTGYGAMLVLWGVAVSILSESDSITSYFPRCSVHRFSSPVFLQPQPGEAQILDAHCRHVRFALCIGRYPILHGHVRWLNYASSSMLMLLVTGSAYTFLAFAPSLKLANPVRLQQRNNQNLRRPFTVGADVLVTSKSFRLLRQP